MERLVQCECNEKRGEVKSGVIKSIYGEGLYMKDKGALWSVGEGGRVEILARK